MRAYRPMRRSTTPPRSSLDNLKFSCPDPLGQRDQTKLPYASLESAELIPNSVQSRSGPLVKDPRDSALGPRTSYQSPVELSQSRNPFLNSHRAVFPQVYTTHVGNFELTTLPAVTNPKARETGT